MLYNFTMYSKSDTLSTGTFILAFKLLTQNKMLCIYDTYTNIHHQSVSNGMIFGSYTVR